MQYVDFGRTGLRVSRLGFGGIPVSALMNLAPAPC